MYFERRPNRYANNGPTSMNAWNLVPGQSILRNIAIKDAELTRPTKIEKVKKECKRNREVMVARLKDYRATGDISWFRIALQDLTLEERQVMLTIAEFRDVAIQYVEHICEQVLDLGVDPEHIQNYAIPNHYRRQMILLVEKYRGELASKIVRETPDSEKIIKYAETMPTGVVREGMLRVAASLDSGKNLESSYRVLERNTKTGKKTRYTDAMEYIRLHVGRALG